MTKEEIGFRQGERVIAYRPGCRFGYKAYLVAQMQDGRAIVTSNLMLMSDISLEIVNTIEKIESEKPQPKVIHWTAETAPFPLALRKKKWAKGVYELFSTSDTDVNSCSNDEDGVPNYFISYPELNSEDSEWETRDGKRCGVEVTE